MWQYEKKLQYPVKIKNPNPKYAKIIISQYGGPDGESGAALRYLTQRYGMPYKEVKGILTDIGTEELAHLEMICAMVYQLTRNLTPEQIKQSGFDTYFVDHTAAVYPIAASGVPWNADYIQAKGDIIADLHEDLAADGTTLQEQHNTKFYKNHDRTSVFRLQDVFKTGFSTDANPLIADLFPIEFVIKEIYSAILRISFYRRGRTPSSP